jgi:hypothetical protein
LFVITSSSNKKDWRYEEENRRKHINVRKRQLEKTSHESSLFEMFINYCGEQVKQDDGWENSKVSTCHRKNTKQILIGTLDGKNSGRRVRRT